MSNVRNGHFYLKPVCDLQKVVAYLLCNGRFCIKNRKFSIFSYAPRARNYTANYAQILQEIIIRLVQ